MLRKILIAVGALIAALAILVMMQPPTFHIERSVTVKAPAEAAFARVNDFHGWREWSPWEGKDPNMARSYEGAQAGNGAVYTWRGNKEVGEGRMTIRKSEPSSLVDIQLEFLAPFPATSTATFTFVTVSDGTRVTWAMDGKNTIMGKVAGLFMNMDKMLGAEFESGLAKLKSAAESAPKPATQAANVAP
ncbi:MAG: SRPBCC family protein [Polyangiaceae bacterium]